MYRKAFANKLLRAKIILDAGGIYGNVVNHAFDNVISIVTALTALIMSVSYARVSMKLFSYSMHFSFLFV